MDSIAATSGTAGCILTAQSLARVTTATAAPAAVLSSSALDFCAPEGLSSAAVPVHVLPGIAPNSSWLPDGTCDTNADCKREGFECNRADERPLCSCIDGVDFCRKIGGCKESPCFSCNRCINAMNGFVFGVAPSLTTTSALASRFQEYCTGTGRPASVCFAVQVAIGNSRNLAYRAAGLCAALQECDVAGLGFSCR
jgi:hypothetical protein